MKITTEHLKRLWTRWGRVNPFVRATPDDLYAVHRKFVAAAFRAAADDLDAAADALNAVRKSRH